MLTLPLQEPSFHFCPFLWPVLMQASWEGAAQAGIRDVGAAGVPADLVPVLLLIRPARLLANHSEAPALLVRGLSLKPSQESGVLGLLKDATDHI
jgi:hypothetical protein